MTLGDVALGTAGLVTLAAPGVLLAYRWRLPQPLLAGFIGSAVAVFGVVLGLQFFGLPLTTEVIRPIWGSFTIAAIALWWFGRMQSRAPFAELHPARQRSRRWLVAGPGLSGPSRR